MHWAASSRVSPWVFHNLLCRKGHVKFVVSSWRVSSEPSLDWWAQHSPECRELCLHLILRAPLLNPKSLKLVFVFYCKALAFFCDGDDFSKSMKCIHLNILYFIFLFSCFFFNFVTIIKWKDYFMFTVYHKIFTGKYLSSKNKKQTNKYNNKTGL